MVQEKCLLKGQCTEERVCHLKFLWSYLERELDRIDVINHNTVCMILKYLAVCFRLDVKHKNYPLQKSGHNPTHSVNIVWDRFGEGLCKPCRVHVFAGRTCPELSKPVYISQNCVLRTKPPYVSAQQLSIKLAFAPDEHDNTFGTTKLDQAAVIMKD